MDTKGKEEGFGGPYTASYNHAQGKVMIGVKFGSTCSLASMSCMIPARGQGVIVGNSPGGRSIVSIV